MSTQDNESRIFLLKEEKVPTALRLLVTPAILAAAVNQFNIIIDTFFLGNFAAVETANAAQTATSSAMTIVFFMNAFSFMLAIGTALFVSQLLGKGQGEKVEQYMANSFVFGWILYILILILLLPMLDSFVGILTKAEAGSAVYDNSYAYITIMVIGFPSMIFQQLSSQTIRAEGQGNLIVKASVISIIVNCIVNYLLIADTGLFFSLHGTNYEAAGAAIATVTAQTTMAVILMSVLFRKSKTNYYINLKKTKFNKEWCNIFKTGMSQFAWNMFLALGTFLIGLSIAQLYSIGTINASEFEVLSAASGITIRLVLMMFLLVNGAVQGVQGFISYQYGSKQYDRLLEALAIIKKNSIIAGVGMFVIFFFGAEFIAGIFSRDPQVVELVAMSLRLFAFTCLVFPLGQAYFGLFAALDRPQLALWSSVFRDGFLFAGFAVLLPYLIGPLGAMIVMPVAILIGSIVIVIFGYFVIRGIENEVKKNNV